MIGSALLLTLSASGTDLKSSGDSDPEHVHQNELFRNPSVSKSPSSTENPFQAQVALGFESNVFEVNSRFENPVGDVFVDSSLHLSVPLKQLGDEVRFDLDGTDKMYFRENQLDEYLLRPALVFAGLDLRGATLEVETRAALLRERIFNQFGRIPGRSEPGASGGFGWNLDSDFSAKRSFSWSGEAEYQTFFSAPNDNVRIASNGEFQFPVTKQLEWNAGTEWEFQRYRVRPHDSESRINPRSLATLEGRAFIGLESHLGNGYTFEGNFNAGPNLDLTNGYYNAGVIAAQVEIRRQIGRWKLKGSAEPELVWFTRRPGNLGRSGNKLVTQEYVFEFEIAYEWTKHVRVFCAEELHFQDSSSDESKEDAVLNSFINNTLKGGLLISF